MRRPVAIADKSFSYRILGFSREPRGNPPSTTASCESIAFKRSAPSFGGMRRFAFHKDENIPVTKLAGNGHLSANLVFRHSTISG